MQSLDKVSNVVRLQEIVEPDYVSEDRHSEFLMSQFLEDITTNCFNQVLEKDIGNWRLISTMIYNIGQSIPCFNSIEIQDHLVPTVLQLLK